MPRGICRCGVIDVWGVPPHCCLCCARWHRGYPCFRVTHSLLRVGTLGAQLSSQSSLLRERERELARVRALHSSLRAAHAALLALCARQRQEHARIVRGAEGVLAATGTDVPAPVREFIGDVLMGADVEEETAQPPSPVRVLPWSVLWFDLPLCAYTCVCCVRLVLV